MAREKLITLKKSDFTVQTFRAGGKGGQHQNKKDTGVRIIHGESGAVGESREERSQYQNKRNALKRLSESKEFKFWLNKIIFELTGGKTIDERVDEMMTPGNIQVEAIGPDGGWIEWQP